MWGLFIFSSSDLITGNGWSLSTWYGVEAAWAGEKNEVVFLVAKASAAMCRALLALNKIRKERGGAGKGN
jgi:hypothetical protein